MVIRDLKVVINKKNVLQQIDCYEGSEVYDEVVREYDEILERMYSFCEPVFIIEKGIVGADIVCEELSEGTHILMVIYSIGNKISEYSTESFAKGDYLKGMLADAMADSALFSLEKEFEPILRKVCAEQGMGISRRLEAPHDIPIEYQKYVWEKTRAKEVCGINISLGYMLEPVKSNSIIFVLTEEQEIFRFQHDCKNCANYDCKMRHVPDVPVLIKEANKTYTVMVKEKQSILDALIAVDSSYTAVCGGNGRCAKCKIRVIEGELPITSSDKECFSEEELILGFRLSCRAFPKEAVTVELQFCDESDFMVISDYGEQNLAEFVGKEESKYGIAIDIGTTTIAMQLVNLHNGAVVLTHTMINHQRIMGADVISRIKASVQGKKEALRTSICSDIDEGVRYIINKSGVLALQIEDVVIAGNTTMIHLLMGYDCRELGVYPFTPVNIHLIENTYEAIIGSEFLSARVMILPGISAFVGGDIVSGLYQCDVDKKDEYTILVDLGTNGEIALGNSNRILVTSTAAGPAFEGGNIKCGVGSIEGAISSANLKEKGFELQTIGNKTPTGICGTGVVEIVAELVKAELVDETGYLDEQYFNSGYPIVKTVSGSQILFTQQDVREIQLAKAAIRAGIETLVLRYGIRKEDISYVYLAGGFGLGLDCQKAITIGMIPEEFSGKISAIGNSSLGGAVKCLLSKDVYRRILDIEKCSEEINLSADKAFNEYYIEYMCFERG